MWDTTWLNDGDEGKIGKSCDIVLIVDEEIGKLHVGVLDPTCRGGDVMVTVLECMIDSGLFRTLILLLLQSLVATSTMGESIVAMMQLLISIFVSLSLDN